MMLYRVTGTNKCEWTRDREHAHSIAVEWARSLAKYHGTGTVAVDSLAVGMRNPDRLVDALNGRTPLTRRYAIYLENGVPVEEVSYTGNRPKPKIALSFIDTVAHPTHRHADWAKTVHEIPEYQALLRSAPDAKSALIAFRLAGIDISRQGHKITPAIVKYLWDWVNSAPPSRKR